MNNISIYLLVCKLKDRLENNPDSSKAQINEASILINKVNAVLDLKERRK